MKQTSQQQLDAQRSNILQEIATWIHLNEHGGQDPFWPDGCNMNLTRNHIIYYKQEIERICEESGLALPEEYYLQTPPEVDNDYMAKDGKFFKQRKKNMELYHGRITTKKTDYDHMQMSLF